MKNIGKKHDSCVRVLDFLKLLIQKDIDIKDINNNGNSSLQHIEATETFLKYISTLEFSGFDVKKCGKKYSLYSFFKTIELNDKEIKLLSDIYSTFDKCCVESKRDYLDSLFLKIFKCLNESSKAKILNIINNSKKSNFNNLSEKAVKYQNYVDISQKLKITYRGKNYTVEPKSAEIEKNKIYFIVYNPYTAENMKLLTDDIENIQVLPLKNSELNMMSTIVFEVYDRLAVNYRLRENERMQTCSDLKKVIISYGEDRKDLIKRLLKYGENCKVISPKPFKDEFLKELSLIEAKFQGV